MDMLPCMTEHVFFESDILYCQSDVAEYVYFLYEDEVPLFSDISQENDMTRLINYKDKFVLNI